MSEQPSRLQIRLSLPQLRKQAKELIKLLRSGDPNAMERLRAFKLNAAEPILADAYFVLARELGFESWPKLVHHLNANEPDDIAQHQQIAQDLVAVYNSADIAAAQRLNDLFHSSLDIQQIHDFIRDKLYSLSDTQRRVDNFTITDAQDVLARIYGFEDWDEFVTLRTQPADDPHSAPVLLSSKPPFYLIDWTRNRIEPRQPMSTRDWETLCDVINEYGITAINSASLISDDNLERISRLDQVTSLNLDGSNRLTEKGLQHLARMPQLRELTFGGSMTDLALSALTQLRELRVLRMFWQANISDAGFVSVKSCEKLEEVDLLGCNLGDGALAALAHKPQLRKLKTGRNVTDDGLRLLQQFPSFRTPLENDGEFGLMSFEADPTNLLLDGPFTRNGLENLQGLDGLVGLSFFWHTSNLRGADLQGLKGLSNLAFLGCNDALCDDDAMEQMARMPKLRMLMGQGSVATDKGFRKLSESQSLEYFWGRKCPNFNDNAFVALSQMSSLKGLAVSCHAVSNDALAIIPEFPALKEFLPMDVSDEGFRYVGQSQQIESLILMYCRDTTDVATSHLVDMPRLKKYHAGYTLITDASLEMLSRIKSLEQISFEGCKFISDIGIQQLGTLPRLRELSIGGCPRVTRTGIASFSGDVRVNYDTR